MLRLAQAPPGIMKSELEKVEFRQIFFLISQQVGNQWPQVREESE